MGGAWRFDGAADTWRAEQDGPVRRVVGVQPGGEGTCVVAWQAEADVPDGPAYAALFGAVLAGTVGIALGMRVAGGPGALVGGPAAMGLTLAVGRRWIRSRLPDAGPVEEALGREVRDALARIEG